MSEDFLDAVQGRWQVGDDFIVIEADQIWFLGDSEVFGTLDGEATSAGFTISFIPSSAAIGDGSDLHIIPRSKGPKQFSESAGHTEPPRRL